MKALSIKQPWAWLIAVGYKDVENRSWKTNLRGRIYIHAGKKPDRESLKNVLLSEEGPLDSRARAFARDLARTWKESAIIGEVDIVDCVTHSDSPWFTGRYGFVLANPVLYETIIPCKGTTKFFTPEIEPKHTD